MPENISTVIVPQQSRWTVVIFERYQTSAPVTAFATTRLQLLNTISSQPTTATKSMQNSKDGKGHESQASKEEGGQQSAYGQAIQSGQS